MKVLTATATHLRVTCSTSCCKSRKTRTLAPDLPPLAPRAQDLGLDLARDQAQAVAHQLVELLAAEQVSRFIIKLYKNVFVCNHREQLKQSFY